MQTGVPANGGIGRFQTVNPMAKTLTAVEYLAGAEKYPPRPVCVVFGDEAFLSRQSLRKLRAAVWAATRAISPSPRLKGEPPNSATCSKNWPPWPCSAARRLVVVEEADEFISRYRAELEDYVARPSPTAVLALEAASWPSNTRLYKAVAAEGLAIDCTVPAAAQLARWLGGWAKQTHAVELPLAAAEMLVESTGAELGLIDQELAKMAPMAEKGKISEELVGTHGRRLADPHRLGNARRRPGRQGRRGDAGNSTGCCSRARTRSDCSRRFPPRSAGSPRRRD